MYRARQKFADDKLCEAAPGQAAMTPDRSLISRLTLETPLVFIIPQTPSPSTQPCFQDGYPWFPLWVKPTDRYSSLWGAR